MAISCATRIGPIPRCGLQNVTDGMLVRFLRQQFGRLQLRPAGRVVMLVHHLRCRPARHRQQAQPLLALLGCVQVPICSRDPARIDHVMTITPLCLTFLARFEG